MSKVDGLREGPSDRYVAQEPVFRSSEGKTVVPFSKKQQSIQREKREREDLLNWTLSRLDFSESEAQAQSILDDYNATLGTVEVTDQALTKEVKSISLGGKKFSVHQSQMEDRRLSLVPERVSPERPRISVEQVWSRLRQDPRLVNILSYMTTGQFFNTERITLQTVKDFYREFPTEDEYMKNERIGQMLDRLKSDESRKMYLEYYAKAIEFVDTMYPED